MADRSVTVRLRATTSEFVQAMDKAGHSVTVLTEKFEAAPSAADKIGDAAKKAGKTVAAGLAVGVAAGVTLGVSLAHVGAQYNTLEQQSRAAFTSILQSKDAANQLMDEIAAFAKTSPFPRQAFIEAAQTLAAFGFEGQKVVPTLEAVQNTVAAIGGNAADIQDISGILAKIRSSAQISQIEVRQLALHGINLAQILGPKMNMSEEQFRNSLYGAPLRGAEAIQALDLLIDGMNERFAGAAENVKNTWIGAVDRIKGARRDVASALMEPFISKQGGGAALDWANQFADSLRHLEAEAIPALVPGLTHFGESVSAVMDKATAAVQKIDRQGVERVLGQMREVGPAGAAAAAGVAALGGSSVLHAVGLGKFAVGLNPVAVGLATLLLSTPEVRTELGHLLQSVEPLAGVLISALGPALGLVSTAAADVLPPLIEIVAHLVSGLTPAVEAGAQVVGLLVTAAGPLLGLLGGMLGIVADLTGLVMGNQVAFGLLATVIGLSLLPALTRAATSVVTFATGLGESLTRNATSAKDAISGLGKGTAASAGSFLAANAAGLALGGAIGIVAYAASKMAEEKRKAAERVREFTDAIKADNGALGENTRQTAINTLEKAGALKVAQEMGFSLQRATDAALGDSAAQQELAAALKAAHSEGKISTDQAIKLGKAVADSGDATDKATESVKRTTEATAGATGATKEAVKAFSVFGEQVIDTAGALQLTQEQLDAVQKSADAVAKAFGSSFDVIKGFKPESVASQVAAISKKVEAASAASAKAQTKSAEDVAKAEDKLTAAVKKRDQLTERQAEKDKQTVADRQKLADVNDKVTKATENLADAQQKATESAKGVSVATGKVVSEGEQLARWYQENVRQAEEWANGIAEVTKKGLDPRMIQRLLEAGPEAAGPLLRTLLSDHAGRLVGMVNESERKLQDISAKTVQFTVEMARLQQQAVSSATDEMSGSLDLAMRIAAEKMRQGTRASLESVAAEIGVSKSKVLEAARLFGIDLADAIQAGVMSRPIMLRIVADYGGRVAGLTSQGGQTAYASGGIVTGPGTGTSDSILAAVSNGEGIVNARAVNHYGTGIIHALNALSLPRFAAGGVFTPAGRTYPSSTSAAVAAAAPDVNVRVFLGDRELTDMVRVEVDGQFGQLASAMAYGSS